LKDNEITSNIAFYKESSREVKFYGIKEFKISEDLKMATCPNEITTEDYYIATDITNNSDFKVFKFEKKICKRCPLQGQCIYRDKKGKPQSGGRRLKVPVRYDAMLHDLKRVETKEFEEAINKRYKIERRFATMVRNHGLRRSRYVKLGRTKIHIILANMACNIVRMVNILCPPSVAVSQN